MARGVLTYYPFLSVLLLFCLIFPDPIDILVDAAPTGGVECLIGYGQRGSLGQTGVSWTRVCPDTRYCWEGTTSDIEKAKKLYEYEWDPYYTEFYVRGCGGDFDTPILDPWRRAETPPSLKQPKKHPSEYPLYINLTLAPQVKGQGGEPFWDSKTNQIGYRPVILDLKYTCRRNFCDRARVSEEAICFAGTENVRVLVDARRNLVVNKPLVEVEIGDNVLVMKSDGSKFLYSPIIALPHARNEYSTTFMQIVTNNTDLKLTQQHLLKGIVTGCSSTTSVYDFKLLPAVVLTVGSCVLTLEGPEEIVDINLEHGVGIYSAVAYEADSLLVVCSAYIYIYTYIHTYIYIFFCCYCFFQLSFLCVGQ